MNKTKDIIDVVMKIDVGECVVRKCRPQDAVEHMKACRDSANYLGDFLEWGLHAHTWDFPQHARWINHHVDVPEPYESYSVFLGSKMVGFFSYGPAADLWGVQLCYWVRKGYEGNGIATTITEFLSVKAFYFKGFSYVEIHVDTKNLASRKVPEKLGFEIDEEYSCTPHGAKETGRMLVYVKYNPRQPRRSYSQTYSLGNGKQSYMTWSQATRLMSDSGTTSTQDRETA
jgi:RimJ/RimL family protein N-acetyltransferase